MFLYLFGRWQVPIANSKKHLESLRVAMDWQRTNRKRYGIGYTGTHIYTLNSPDSVLEGEERVDGEHRKNWKAVFPLMVTGSLQERVLDTA